jgi:hypothetical protein
VPKYGSPSITTKYPTTTGTPAGAIHKPTGNSSDPIYTRIGTGSQDGSSGNPFYVYCMRNGGGGDDGAIAGVAPTMRAPDNSVANDLQYAGGMMTSMAPLAGMAVGGVQAYQAAHRADGGDVEAGGSYIVGERGPEPFFPGTSGTIMSHASAERMFGGGGGSGGGDVHIHNPPGVDVNQIYANVHRAIRDSSNETVARSVQAVHDSKRR